MADTHKARDQMRRADKAPQHTMAIKPPTKHMRPWSQRRTRGQPEKAGLTVKMWGEARNQGGVVRMICVTEKLIERGLRQVLRRRDF